MDKYWYLFAAVLGIPTTLIIASCQEVGWTILGVACVGINLYNYLTR